MATTGGTSATPDTGRVKTVRYLALAVGVLFTVIGVLGFFVTGFDNFASHTDETLLGFEINPLHNIVHLLIGIAGIVMSRSLSTARTFGWLLVIGYGAAFLYGLFAVNNPSVNFLSINWADNWLHLVSVLVGLVIALLPVTSRTGTAASAGPR